MFDFTKAIVIGSEFRRPLLESARTWLEERVLPGHYFGIEWETDILTLRNRAIRDVALPKAAELGTEWVMFIDNDVTITHPGIERFLAVEADVASCCCRMRTADAWSQPTSFHTPFWFARMDVFRALEPPWFRYTYSPDGCEMVACECEFFRQRVLAAGFDVRCGGWCGHGLRGSWCG